MPSHDSITAAMVSSPTAVAVTTGRFYGGGAASTRPPSPGPEPLAYSIPEAVRVSHISRAQLYRYRQAGRLTIRKRGTRSFILREDLQALLRSLPRLGD